MSNSLVSRGVKLLPVLAVAVLLAVSAVPASAQYYGNYYGSSYGYPYSNYGYNNYGYNNYNYGYNYPSSNYYGYNNYNSYGYQYPYYSNNYYGSQYPYYSNNYYGSQYPYYNNYNYGYQYPSYNNSSYYGYNNCAYNYGYQYPYYSNYNYGYQYPYYSNNYYNNCTTTASTTLAAPTGVVLSNLTGTSVTITWNTVAGATSYLVMQSTSGGSYFTVLSTGTTTATVGGLSPNITYSFQIVAQGPYGQSPASTAVPTTGGGTGALTAPVVTPSKSGNNVTLTWAPVSGASTYQVLQSFNGGQSVYIATNITVTGTQGGVQITGLANGTYSYQVVAVAANGSSSVPSNAVIVTIP
jgi:hypothetical protein